MIIKKKLEKQEKTKIINTIKEKLNSRKEILFAYVHGSFIMPIPCGDIDIAVFLEESAVSPRHWEYEANLSAQLDRHVGLPVDILTLNVAPVTLRYHATRGKLLLSKNEPARLHFLESTWREYFDYQPLLKAYYMDLLD